MKARIALWIGGILLTGVGSLYAVATVVVDEGFVERRLSGLLARAPGDHDVSVDEVAVRPLRRGIRIASLRIEPASGFRGGANPAPVVGPEFRLHVSELEIDGIDLLSAARGSFAALDLRAHGLRLIVAGLRDPAEEPDVASGAPAGIPPRPSGVAGGDLDPPSDEPGGFRFEAVRIANATVDVTVSGRPAAWNVIVTPADVQLDGVALGGPNVTSVREVVLASLSELRAGLLLARRMDGHRSVELRDLLISPASGVARSEGARLLKTRAEDSGSDPWPGGGSHALDTTLVTATGLMTGGFALDTADGATSASGRSLVVDSLSVLFVDAIAPDTTPDARKPAPKTPVQRLGSAGLAARVDSMTVEEGWIRYRELRPGRRRSGEILFDDLEGSVTPLVTGPSRNVEPDTVTVSVRARLQGSSPVRLDVGFPGGEADFSFTANGAVADVALSSLNSMFRPIDGVHFQAGWLDTLSFHLDVVEGLARGSVRPVYADLDLGLENPSSGGKGIGEHVRGFFMNLRLNSDNRPTEGDDFRVGSVERRAEPGETFLQVLWQSVLAGLRDVASV